MPKGFKTAIIFIGLLLFVAIFFLKTVLFKPLDLQTAGLKVLADIPLAGGNSRFDYQSIDDKQRLFLTHLGSNMVTVFDLTSQKILTDISNISQPHGILAVPEIGLIYVSATGTNEVAVINKNSLKVIKNIPVGNFPDGLAYTPNEKKIFVSDESGGTVSVIDTKTNKFIENIEIDGEVGNTQYDPVSKLIYSAAQSKNELVAIDPSNDKITARYHIDGCSGPHGFYIDTSPHEAFITCEENSEFFVFDLDAKKVIYKNSVGTTPDVLAFDHGLNRLYVASESGILSAFEINQDGTKKLWQGFLANNAHTISVDEISHRIYFPLENVDGRPVLRIIEAK